MTTCSTRQIENERRVWETKSDLVVSMHVVAVDASRSFYSKKDLERKRRLRPFRMQGYRQNFKFDVQLAYGLSLPQLLNKENQI